MHPAHMHTAMQAPVDFCDLSVTFAELIEAGYTEETEITFFDGGANLDTGSNRIIPFQMTTKFYIYNDELIKPEVQLKHIDVDYVLTTGYMTGYVVNSAQYDEVPTQLRTLDTDAYVLAIEGEHVLETMDDNLTSTPIVLIGEISLADEVQYASRVVHMLGYLEKTFTQYGDACLFVALASGRTLMKQSFTTNVAAASYDHDVYLSALDRTKSGFTNTGFTYNRRCVSNPLQATLSKFVRRRDHSDNNDR